PGGTGGYDSGRGTGPGQGTITGMSPRAEATATAGLGVAASSAAGFTGYLGTGAMGMALRGGTSMMPLAGAQYLKNEINTQYPGGYDQWSKDRYSELLPPEQAKQYQS